MKPLGVARPLRDALLPNTRQRKVVVRRLAPAQPNSHRRPVLSSWLYWLPQQLGIRKERCCLVASFPLPMHLSRNQRHSRLQAGKRSLHHRATSEGRCCPVRLPRGGQIYVLRAFHGGRHRFPTCRNRSLTIAQDGSTRTHAFQRCTNARSRSTPNTDTLDTPLFLPQMGGRKESHGKVCGSQ